MSVHSSPPGAFAFVTALLACAALLGCAVRPKADPVDAGRLDREAAAPVPGGAPNASAGAWVQELASDDFGVRNRAAESLVALGEGALPTLGLAGDRTVAAHGKVAVSTTRPVVAAILEKVPADRLVRVHLPSEAALVRRGAAEELGRRELWAGVPELIERLTDSDASVRVASLGALRRITNRFYDVDAEAPPAVRVAAVEQGRAWWNREGHRAAVEPAHRAG